jgi:hypothetical protein
MYAAHHRDSTSFLSDATGNPVTGRFRTTADVLVLS